MRVGIDGIKTAAVTCLLSVVMHGCSRESVGKSSTAVETPGSTSGVAYAPVENVNPPSSLTDAAEAAENVYDLAAANDWNGAALSVTALGEVVKKVRADVRRRNDVKDDLDGHTLALDRAVGAHNRWVAMREANQVTLAVADLTGSYKLDEVPVELMRLDYYGRELAIWAEVQDTVRLKTTTSQMVEEWDRLRPAIDARNPAADGRKVGDLLAQAEDATTAADYAQLSKAVLDEVDHLETLFGEDSATLSR
jgi:hypothetical protein